MMSRAQKTYMLDRLIEAGIANPVYTSHGGDELHFVCPIKTHEHDSDRKTAFSVNLDKMLFHCFKCGVGGTPFKLAEATLGSREAALHLYGVVNARSGDSGGGFRLKVAKSSDRLQRRKEASAGPPVIDEHFAEWGLEDKVLTALIKNNNLSRSTLYFDCEYHQVIWAGQEWFAFPALTTGSFKLWAVDFSGKIRREDGSIAKRNVGPVSLIASNKLREALAAGQPKPIPVLYDVEGEGDLLGAIENGLDPVLTSTGGAGTISGHERCRSLLAQLDIGEVQIVRDRDDAGRHGADLTAKFWATLKVPTKIIELPEEVGDGGDLRDYHAILHGRKQT